MTTPTDPDQPTTDRPDNELEKSNTAPVSNPPNTGVNYYNRLIDLETCTLDLVANDRSVGISYTGNLHDMDDFKTALYQIYKSMFYLPRKLLPKIFRTFADASSEELKHPIRKKLVKAPNNRSGVSHRPVEDVIARKIAKASALGYKHGTQGHSMRTKESILKSVLPDHTCEQSA